ncbi:MAG TPA: family 16 glycoside hydrolase [Caulobacterales bacterium]|nr:family 16 glycoside hydrolase [Caulobacterales bacterium]
MRFLAAILVALSTATAAAQDQPAPELTEIWTPVPAKVAPGANAAPPSDAVVLFDGRDLSKWEGASGGEARWNVSRGVITVAPGTGDIRTRESFGDMQLHIEWRPPVLPADKTGQDRGNSGVFLQERYEVQVLDTFENRTYVNGQAGSIYKQYPPLVNASLPPGQWQSYDIIYTAPRFNGHMLVSPARVTVLQNGVLVQNNVTLAGSTTYRGQPAYEPHGEAPLRLQDHGHLVSFRNIWIRRL